MKNTITKLTSIAFAFAMLVSLVPTSQAALTGNTTLNGVVTSGLAIVASAASGDMTIDPVTDVFSDTATSTLTVDNNAVAGFNIKAQLTAGDTDVTTNTLGIAGTTDDLVSEDAAGSSIAFASAEGANLASGTDQVNGAFTTADEVYTNTDEAGSQTTDGIVDITYTFTGTTALTPATYTGTVVYTISAGA